MKFYNVKDQPEKTLELFQRMQEENLEADEICYVLVIDALSKVGDLSLTHSVVDDMPPNFLENSWIQVGLIDLWVKYLLLWIGFTRSILYAWCGSVCG